MNTTATSKARRVSYLWRGLWLALIFALGLEVAARLEDWIRYGAPPLRNYTFDQLFRLTRDGPRGVPHGHYMRWALNSYGLHGPEISMKPGQVGVIVSGASEAFGIYEDEGKEFPRVLERDLNARTAPGRFVVINAGMPGMTPHVSLELVRQLRAQFRARILEILPSPTEYISATRPFCSKPIKYQPPDGFTWPQSRVAGKLFEKAKAVLPESFMTLARSLLIDWQVGDRAPLKTVSAQSLEAMAADIRCEVQTARELGMIPIIVTHPNRFGNIRHPDDEAQLVEWRYQYPILEESGFVDLEDRANTVIRNTARAEGGILVDADAQMSGHSELFADHAHYTDEGAAVMASLLVPAVLDAYAQTLHGTVTANSPAKRP